MRINILPLSVDALPFYDTISHADCYLPDLSQSEQQVKAITERKCNRLKVIELRYAKYQVEWCEGISSSRPPNTACEPVDSSGREVE